MASIVANLPSPLLVNGRRPLLTTLPKFTVSATEGSQPGFHHWRGQRMGLKRQSRVAIVVKATGESSESSTSLSVVKSVQNVWDSSEDRLALIGLGFAAVVAVWASANLITLIRWHGMQLITSGPFFALDPRNLRLGLVIDGFNPFTNLSSTYSCWPVMLVTYNLPSWLCMAKENIMLTLLIPNQSNQVTRRERFDPFVLLQKLFKPSPMGHNTVAYGHEALARGR